MSPYNALRFKESAGRSFRDIINLVPRVLSQCVIA